MILNFLFNHIIDIVFKASLNSGILIPLLFSKISPEFNVKEVYNILIVLMMFFFDLCFLSLLKFHHCLPL